MKKEYDFSKMKVKKPYDSNPFGSFILVSNLTLKNGSLRFDWNKPFDLLAKVDSKEKWWTRPGSNR